MNQNNPVFKVWRVIYPLILYFLLDVIVVWAASALATLFIDVTNPEQFRNVPAIANIVFNVVAIPILYTLYKRDYNAWSVVLYRKPVQFLVLFLLGAAASHGLSALVSLMDIDSIVGNYEQIEQTVYMAAPWLVIIQTVVLAPLGEELLFRGLIYKRIERYTKSFWIPAIISALLFGLYHWNLAQGLFAFLFGLLTAAVYDTFQNLWATITLHAGANLLSVILVYTNADYSTQWAMAIAGALCIFASAAVYFFLVRPVGAAVKKDIGELQ